MNGVIIELKVGVKMKWKIRFIIHRLIVKYLRSCGGAFHHGQYGQDGKYIVMMSDSRYHDYQCRY